MLLLAALFIWAGFGQLNLSPVFPYFKPHLNFIIADRLQADAELDLETLNVSFDRQSGMFEIEALDILVTNSTGAAAALDRAFFKVPLEQAGRRMSLGPVILSGVEIDVTRDIEGEITVNGFTMADLQDLAGLATLSAGGATPPPVLINDIDAVLEDEQTALSIPLRGERVDVISLNATTQIFGQLRVREGDFVGSRVSTALSLPRDEDERILEMELAGFDLSTLDQSGLVELSDLELTGLSTGSVVLTFDRSFALQNLSGEVSVENGGLSGAALPDDLRVLFAEGGFSFDPQTNEVAVTDVIATGDIWTASLNFDGAITENEAGELIGVSGVAASLTASLNAPEIFTRPHILRAEQMPVSLQLTPFFFSIDAVQARLDDIPITLSGTSAVEDHIFVHRYRSTSDTRNVEDVLTFWPVQSVPNTRRWALRALEDAEINNLNAAVSIIDEKVSLRMGFEYADLTANIIQEFPPVSNARGSALLTETDFLVTIDAGTVFLPNEAGGVFGVDVAGSQFYIPDITPKVPTGEAVIFPKATLDATEAVLDHPPFSFLSKAGITPPDASAIIDGELRISVPLQKTITVQDVDIDARLFANGLRSTDLVRGQTVQADRLSVRTNGQVLTITGEAEIANTPGEVSFLQNLSAAGLTTVTIDTFLTEELAAAFNFPTDDIRMSGRTPLNVDLLFAKSKPTEFTATTSLRGLSMSVPLIGWSKREDRTGRVVAKGSIDEETTSPITFEFDALGLTAQGVFSEGETDIRDAKVGTWFEGSARLVEGQYPIINARRLDLRTMPDGLGGNGNGGLDVSVDRMDVANGIYVTGLKGLIEPRKIDFFTGRLNDRVPIKISLSQEQTGPVYTITGSDAGTALRMIGIMDGVREGDFEIELADTPEGFDGSFEMKRIRVRTGSAIVTMVDALSFVGLLQQFEGPGVRFETVRGKFSIQEEGVELRQTNAVGASLGFTTAGVYLFDDKKIDLEGTVTPIYPINGALVRTFNEPFGRERGEGLFSFTYRMKGEAGNPRVRVNPLSFFLPGMLREIFRPKTPVLADYVN